MVEVPSNPVMRRVVDRHQRAERTGAALYGHLARRASDAASRELFLRLSEEETRHAEIWQYYCGRKIGRSWPKYLFLVMLSRLLGRRFLFRVLKHEENAAVTDYKILLTDFPELEEVYHQEETHEAEMLRLLDQGAS